MERQFVRGFIDGALSVLGVVIGASAGQIDIIISAGIGGGVANGISNVFGAFTAERVQEEREFQKIEKSMLVELRETELYKTVRRRVMIRGLVDGISTVIGSIVPVLPFILAFIIGFSAYLALAMSVSFTAISLGIIGIYFGRISKENIIVSSSKMVLMGIVTAIISFGIERGIHHFIS